MTNLLRRILVVLTALPTYLVAVAVAAPFVAAELAKIFPANAEAIVAFGGSVVVIVGAVVNIIRRVTPVAKPDRGLLPPAGDAGDDADL